MEKLRHQQLNANSNLLNLAKQEISIQVDKESKTFIIQDYGIGMSREEMIDFLGTIARSGKQTVKYIVWNDRFKTIHG